MLWASGGTDHQCSQGDMANSRRSWGTGQLKKIQLCLRGSFVRLCIGEVVEDASFQGVQRASLGRELGPFLYSRDGAGEGNHSAQEKLAAVQLHFFIPISPLKGVLRQNGSITRHCVSSWQVWGTAAAAALDTNSPKLCLIPHFMLMSCHQIQTTSLQPSCHMPRWLQEQPAHGGGWYGHF